MSSNNIDKVSFPTLPPDILTRIAFVSILHPSKTPTPEDLSTLIALLFTSRALHTVLSLTTNPDLYAQIFRQMFDIAPIKRRLGAGAIVSSSLAREFPSRVKLLIRIKAAASEETGYWSDAGNREDWKMRGNSYVRKMMVMMSENEDKNGYQLAYAGVSKVSDALVTQLLQFGLDSTPSEHQPCMTLTFALLWMLSSQDTLAHEDPHRRGAILDYLEPLMLRANEPSNDLNDLLDKTQTPHLHMPTRYLDFTLQVHMPSITQIARLCSVDRYSAAKNIPWTGTGGFETRCLSSSTRFDIDWLRMVSILDQPTPPPMQLTGNPYLVGNFDGMFEGAFFITHPIDDNQKFFTSSRPMQCTLREYHSVSPYESLRFDEGDDRREGGEGLARAWFPEDVQLNEGATSLTIHDHSQRREFHYKPYPECMEMEFSEHESPSIFDTILIGETHPSYANYGQYNFRGRVRARDGTVALIRTPAEPNMEDEGTWIFVGHLHAETDLVGDWRVASIREDIPGGHGWFHISKTQVFGPLGL